MKSLWGFITLFILFFGFNLPKAGATHSRGADLSYRCLGGNNYEITVSFYRDCNGQYANPYIYVHFESASCGLHDSLRVYALPGTGQEITEVCVGELTTCQGGSHIGIQEWVYRDTITLPQACTDWRISYTQCCRNGAITNITTPTNDSLYIFAQINNSAVSCNNSPTFSNKPVPFACVNQSFCFSHMASDPDGDSLVYSLITPYNSSTGRVQYLAGFDSSQALSSSPPITFNTTTGEICMTPTSMQITVMAVLVDEYRNGVWIGSVERDIQIIVSACNNVLPTASGINGSSLRADTICASQPYCFTINTGDPNASQNTTLTWDSSIAGAFFIVNPAYRSSATFCWTPPVSAVSSTPHCFSVTVRDNNCPINGLQVYTYCLTVEGITVTSPDVLAPCNANAVLLANASGGTGPLTYTWSTGATGNSIMASPGQYVVTATDGICLATDTAQVLPGAGVPIAGFTYVYSCTNNSVEFTDASTPSSSTAITSWSWDFGDGNTGSGASPTHVYAAAGTYPVQLIIQSSSGCSDTLTRLVAAGGPNPVSAFAAAPVCRGTTTTFLDNSQAVAGNLVSWQWDFGDGGTSTASNPSHLFTGAGTYPVTLIVGNTAGCYDTLSVPVTVFPDPLANAGNDTSFCRYSNLQLQATGGASYTWSPGGDTTAVVSVSPLITTVYTVTVTDSNGCIATDNIQVTVNATPAANAGNPVTICDSNSTTLQATGGGNYLWMPGNWAGANYTVAPSATTLYTLVVSNAAGCSDTDQVTVTVRPNPVAFAGNDTSVCLQSSVMLTGSGSGNYLWNPGAVTNSTMAVSPSVSTLFSLVVTNSYGCRDTDWVFVQVLPLPTAFAGNDSDICLNDTATLRATGNGTISWSPINSSASVVYVNPVVSTIYTLSVTGSNGCTAQDVVSITVQPLPVASAGPDTSVCFGNFITLQASGGTGYSWNPGPGISSSLVVSPAVSTSYVVTVSNAYQCMSSDTVDVTVHPNPVALAGNDTAICLNDTALLQAIGGNSYLWSTGASTPSIQVVPASTSDYFVVVTDLNSCQDTDSVRVVVNLLPVASAGPDTTVCLNEIVNLIASGGTAYSWSPGAATGAIYPVSPADTTQYTVTVTDGNNCSAVDSVIVFINELPVALASPDTSLCLGASATLSAQGGNSYTWQPGNQSLQTITVSPATTTTYTVTVSDGNSCRDTALLRVIVNPVPVVAFNVQSSVCEEEDIGLQNNSTVSSGSLHYFWDFDDGFQSVLAQPAYSYNQAGNYAISLVATSDSGCSAQASFPVTVRPNPVAAFTVPGICALNSVQFTNQSQDPGGPVRYSWDFGNGLTDTAFSPFVYFSQAGQYSVRLIVTTSGCSDSATHPLTVYPVPHAQFNGSTVCESTPTTFSNSSWVAAGSIVTWNWNFGDTTTSANQHPTHTYLRAGNFPVSLVAVSGAGCSDTSHVMLRVNPRPLPSFDANGACLGQEIQFTDLSQVTTGFIAQWLWQFGDGTVSTQQNPRRIYPMPGQYGVQLTVTTDSGCAASITVPAAVEVYPLPEPSFTATPNHVQDLFPRVEFTNTTPGNNFYSWNFGDSTGSTDYSPFHDYTRVGIFNVLLVVTNLHGCIDSTWSRVEVEQGTAIYLPNSFTPNSDGSNDIFRPVYYNQRTIKADIFNRWGELIYSWDGLEGGWDGHTNGIPAPIDVYVCRLTATDVNGKTRVFLENVTLVR